MKKIIILIGHKKQVGKDTLANKIKEVQNVQIFHFADKLKETVKDLYNLTEEHVNGSLKESVTKYVNYINDESKYLTSRKILQIFGQQQRSIYPDIWVSYVFNQIERSRQSLFVVPDFRFRNEYNYAYKWCAMNNAALIAIKIDRPSLVHTSKDLSENDLNDFEYWDFVLTNDGTKNDLLEKFIIEHNKWIEKEYLDLRDEAIS
jgi:hypothetical protein